MKTRVAVVCFGALILFGSQVAGLFVAERLALGRARVTASQPCYGTLLQRYDDAWQRWHDGLPLRDCDAEALADVKALAERCSEGEL